MDDPCRENGCVHSVRQLTGLSETVDTGRLSQYNDNALVLLDGTSSDDELFDAIGHETGRLVSNAHAEANGTLFDYALGDSKFDDQTVLCRAVLSHSGRRDRPRQPDGTGRRVSS
ncbi:MAG: hypothetical protein V8T86_01930 [Victivallis sp.]